MQFLRMNLFQRMVQQWDVLHPYNAGQLMYVADAIDPQHAAACWSQTLRQLGMGGIEWSGRRYRHIPRDAPATRGAASPCSRLRSTISSPPAICTP